MHIPLVDLKAQYESIQAEIDAAVRRVIVRSAYIGGEEVRSFEQEFAAYCGAKGCVGVGNGTDALYLTLRGLEIGPGAEVITVAHTFIATAEAVSSVGARPVFVDVCEGTMLMDPARLENAITPRTRAIIPVHLYGQPCQMDVISQIAEKHRLKVIEDAAQAHGARWRGRPTGSLGHVACFSFYPGKNLGAYGDAGAVVSQDEDLLLRIRMLANHGRLEKYTHAIEGVSSRLDGLQAAILRVKLQHLDQWNDARKRQAAFYSRALKDCGVELPIVRDEAETVWHLFVIRTPRRDHLQLALAKQGVTAGVHYPVPLHLQPAYQYLNLAKGALPVTERVASQVLSLPIYAELTEQQLIYVADTVRTWMENDGPLNGL